MSGLATWIDVPKQQRYRGTIGIIRILVSVLGILMLQTLFSFTNFYSSLTRANDAQEANNIEDAAVVIDHTPKEIIPAIHQSMMLHSNVLCSDLTKLEKKSRNELPSAPDFAVHISFRMNCAHLFESNKFGTGNVLRTFYNIRLVARLVGNVEVKMECGDALGTKSSLVIPWLLGTFKPSKSSADPTRMSVLASACERFQPENAPIIIDDIKYELRRMALSMVRVPYAGHPAAYFVKDDSREQQLQVPMEASPLFPNAEVDDVAIHFRCGDIIERHFHPNYNYVRWSALAKLISSEARSIGIITQPFTGQTRKVDRSNKRRCPRLVHALQNYMKKKFPRARVQLRNSPDESVALAFTRLIMANQSFAGGVSTFYTMPFYAAFGTTYDVTHHEETNDMIASKQIMGLWKYSNGLQRIVKLFTDEKPRH
jgi:hypothetical protein